MGQAVAGMEMLVSEGVEMKMAVCTETMLRPKWRECVDSWNAKPLFVWDDSERREGLVACMQHLYEMEEVKEYDILCYLHDDVIIHEKNWQERVLKQFEDPKVGVVGFGGSLWHGSPDIYKVPYHISQLGRSYYMSNVDDAEVHGARFTGEKDVATHDGFALCCRRRLLESLLGWPVDHLSFHGYDHWITLSAHRLGYRVCLVGIRCHHLGGQTYTKVNPDPTDHERAHKWLYEEFRDVLPVMVKP